ncbi:MAG: DUF2147 domain-containing protein [Bacteroidota bacterium]
MNRRLVVLFFLVAATQSAISQSVFGKWRTVDDETGETKAIVEIFEKEGKLYGEVVEILNSDRKNARCTKCDGKLKDTPILGLPIIDGFSKDEEGYYKGKRLTDPVKGLTVRGKVWLDPENANQLKVRGYLAFFYRTQTWLRASP